MRPVSVLIVDDNAGVRSGLSGLLGSSTDLHVVGEAWDGERAVELTRSLQPDVVLLDVRMPRRDGVSAAEEIARTSKVLMMTFTEDPEIIRNALAAGASGYLVHGAFDPEDLIGSVLAVARGSGVFSGGALDVLRQGPSQIEKSPPQPDFGLSDRQTEILELIAEGLSNAEIAERCFLSEKTVKNHINRIFAALGVRTRSAAIAHWFRATRPG